MRVFDYSDVQLIPNECIVKSRHMCDTSVKLGPRRFKIPVVPSNMQTVINTSLAIWLAKNGYFYIMHRFFPEKRLAFLKLMKSKGLYSSISVGIKPQEYQFIDSIVKARLHPTYITIDVAHGHSVYVIKMIHYIKKRLPKTFLIVGNLGTPYAVREIENAGADATKIGIGPGRACITKLKTGFGTGGWQLAALKWCSKEARKPMIADGGLRTDGDIAKSIRFGATMVMMGSMLAGHKQSPGSVIMIHGRKYKQYWGSASAKQKGNHQNVEGRQMLVPYRGDIADTLNEMQQDLQSSISYAGGNDLSALKTVDYVILHN